MVAPANPPKRNWPRPQIQDGRRVNMYLAEADILQLKELGNGNMSLGVRRALKLSGRSKLPKDPWD